MQTRLLALASLLVAVAFADGAWAASPNSEQGDVVTDCLRADVNDDTNRDLMSRIVDTCSKALDGQSLSPADRAEAYLNRGMAYRHLGDLQDSLTDLLKAKELAQNDANIARMLAWTYRQMDMQGAAEREYDRSLQLDPHWQAYLSRCVVRVDQNQFAKALNDCETAHKQHKSEDSLFFIALSYQGLGRHAEIVSLIEPELEGQWSSGRLYRVLSEAYAAIGRKNEAARLLVTARQKFPKDPKLNLPPPDP